MAKLGKLKNRILSTRNRRSADQMALINNCFAELKVQKDRLRDSGHPVTWEHFSQTQEYAEIFNGINQSTIDIAKRLWEEA